MPPRYRAHRGQYLAARAHLQLAGASVVQRHKQLGGRPPRGRPSQHEAPPGVDGLGWRGPLGGDFPAPAPPAPQRCFAVTRREREERHRATAFPRR